MRRISALIAFDPTAPARGALARARARLRRLVPDQRGAAAVEFAMVGIPFLALLMGILELAMLFMLSTSLDNATGIAGRTIRTGQMQTAGSPTATTFKTAICNNLGWLGSDCSSNLSVDVRTYSTFSAVTLADPIVNKNLDSAALTFQPGCPGSIVVVRAYYQWTLISPLLTQAVAKLNNGKTLVTSTLTFRNEPYGTTTC